MTYIKVKWKQSNPRYPVLLFSELDSQCWEIRKVEVFANGQTDYADSTRTSGNTKLSIEPIPPIAEIAADPQFEPMEITQDEFETIWNKAIG